MKQFIFTIVGVSILGVIPLITSSSKVAIHHDVVEKTTHFDSVFLDSLLLWSSSNALSWDDFQGSPQMTEHIDYHAMTYIRIPFENYKVYKDSLVLDLPCYFVCRKSWVSEPTEKLLNHEQKHFDIGEIIARKMRKAISHHISTDDIATTDFFKNVSHEYYSVELTSLNHTYDHETKHGKDEIAQKKWDKKIESMLTELESYSSTRVRVVRKKR
jgi:hypothetical protein